MPEQAIGEPASMTTPSVIPPRPTPRVDPVPLLATNVAPIVGMLFLYWSPAMLVALYAIDTLLALYAMSWLVMEHVTEADAPDRGVKRALKLGATTLIIGSFLALVMIGPLFAIYAGGDWLRSQPWHDRGFLGALAVQVAGSLYALARTHRLLNERDDDDAWLGGQFQFLVARWVVVLGVVFTGLALALGEMFGSALIVIVYAGATVWFTMFPDRARRMFFRDKEAPPG